MTVRLPSRYEDLDPEFRGRLKPNISLLTSVQQAFASMEISGGIRFLPVFGQSGSGKTSAALEIGTHLPELYVEQLPREAIEDTSKLYHILDQMLQRAKLRRLVAVVDQYEEVAAQRTAIPSAFVEALSLLDRNRERRDQILFIWLTTSRDFQVDLTSATARNNRILVRGNFEIEAIEKASWPGIIQEMFRFHNQERTLAGYGVLEMDLVEIIDQVPTLGAAIEETGKRLARYAAVLHNLSDYLVVMLWPVTDGHRITRVRQFTDPRQGYRLDWDAWYRQLNQDDRASLPLREYNRARLYFDIRLVPIAAADIKPLCYNLDDDSTEPGKSYLERFMNTHFFSIVSGNWLPDSYAPLRERESKRANDARDWYATVTKQPTALGRRLSICLKALGLNALPEQMIKSPYGKVRADILILNRSHVPPSKVIVELKAFSPENTMPSSIASAILTTLRRHAQFAGFLPRQ